MSRKTKSAPFLTVLAVAGLAFSLTADGVLAQAPTAVKVQLVPHRAVYDLSLDNAAAGANVTDIRGRLVFDFSGSPCKGYNLNTRLVTAIVDREGKASLTDIRSESWEQADGSHFRFNTSQYLNNEQSEATKGEAIRDAHERSVTVRLQKPAKNKIALPGAVMFPTQHSLAILEAAAEGDRRVQANVYDGSEKGDKVYETTTFIGKALPLGANEKLPTVENGAALDKLPSWPVLISYYEGSQSKEGLPVYEISFRLYSNGVSRKLKLDYGTFSLTGEISKIEFKKAAPCSRSHKGKSS